MSIAQEITFTGLKTYIVTLMVDDQFRKCYNNKCYHTNSKPNPSYENVICFNASEAVDNSDRHEIMIRDGTIKASGASNVHSCYPWTHDQVADDDRYK